MPPGIVPNASELELGGKLRQQVRDEERKLEELKAKSNVDVLSGPLAKLDSSGIERQNQGLRERIALETGGAQAVVRLRVDELEAIRRRGLEEAKSAEAEQLVNRTIDARIQAEQNHAGLQQDLKLRQEIAETEARFGALVEKTNQRELSGVQRVEAERAKQLKQVGEFERRGYTGGEKLRSQINLVADKDREEEKAFNFRGRRRLNGNLLQSATLRFAEP